MLNCVLRWFMTWLAQTQSWTAHQNKKCFPDSSVAPLEWQVNRRLLLTESTNSLTFIRVVWCEELEMLQHAVCCQVYWFCAVQRFQIVLTDNNNKLIDYRARGHAIGLHPGFTGSEEQHRHQHFQTLSIFFFGIAFWSEQPHMIREKRIVASSVRWLWVDPAEHPHSECLQCLHPPTWPCQAVRASMFCMRHRFRGSVYCAVSRGLF